MKLGSCKAIFFDMNGLLVNSEDLLPRAGKAFFSAHGVRWHDRYQQEIKGMAVQEYAVIWKVRFGFHESISYIVKELKRLEEQLVYRSGQLKLLPGVIDFLDWVAVQPLRCGLVTTSWRDVAVFVLRRFHIRRYFDVLVTLEDLNGAHSKPAPDSYLIAANKLKISPKECVVFEDSVTGARAAKRAGMACVVVNSTASRRKYPNVGLFVRSFKDARVFDFARKQRQAAALYLGRFQPFHRGHLWCIKKILENNQKLIIGLFNDPSDHRNIFTLSERQKIITTALRAAGIDPQRWRFVVVDRSKAGWATHLHEQYPFGTLYAGNPNLKKPFRNVSCVIRHLPRKANAFSATEIRKRSKRGESISTLVVPGTVSMINALFKEK
ncbi:HAD-IA family hydrolase [Candidatus Uhrbacteria bacterium]|nr:HAD-IA family hydrolase [Candidatus Uhrbacteria bacterium]